VIELKRVSELAHRMTCECGPPKIRQLLETAEVTLRMQVSPPKLGGAAAAVRKWHFLYCRSGVVPKRNVSEMVFEALRFGNHSVRSNMDAYRDIFLMSRPPLLTSERTPASSPSPIVRNSQYGRLQK